MFNPNSQSRPVASSTVTMPNANTAAASDDDKFDWMAYHKKLRTVKRVAVGTNAIYSLNWFLGFCALTWATTVLLGGIVTGIAKHDYYSVALLLLLEALRLAFAHFFCFFVTRHLIYRSAEPSQLDYSDYRNVVVAELLRTAGQVVALIVVSVSIILPIRRLRHLYYPVDHNTQSVSAGNFHGVSTSLWIFYIIVLANAVIAAVGVIYSRTIVQLQFSATSDSLRKYYDKIVWNGIQKGLFDTTNMGFDILRFVFEMMGDEYRHNRRAPTVMYMYSNLMLYLYEYRNHKGFEAAKVALDSEDTFVREAAANIVGCWVKLRLEGKSKEKGIETLLLQKKLLTKLAEALEHEETGRAATYSFETLAKQNPKAIMEVMNEHKQKLTHILMKRVHEVVELKKYDKALVFIKALIPLLPEEYKSACTEVDHYRQETLHQDLREIILQSKTDTETGLEYPKALKRTQAVAAKALFCSKGFEGDLEDINKVKVIFKHLRLPPFQKRLPNGGAPRQVECNLKSIIRCGLVGTVPAVPRRDAAGEHILQEEWDYLKEVLDYFISLGDSRDPCPMELSLDDQNGGLPVDWTGKVLLRKIRTSNYNFPAWFNHIKITSFIVAAVMLILMAGFSCLFILLPDFKF